MLTMTFVWYFTVHRHETDKRTLISAVGTELVEFKYLLQPDR